MSAPTNLEYLADLSYRARTATAARDELIRQLVAAGMSLREVAEAAGLSHTAIAKIRDRA